MKTIATFQVPENAHLFRCFLESRGIEAHVLDENVVQLFWYYSNAIGGVRVVAAEEDIEQAKALHAEYLETLNVEPAVMTEARGWPVVLVLSLLIGLPMLVFGRKPVAGKS